MFPTLFHCNEDGTAEVHMCITEMPYDASKGTAKLCRDNGSAEEKSAAKDSDRFWQDLGPCAGRCDSENCVHEKYHVEDHGLLQARSWRKRNDDEPSLSLMSASTASCSKWRTCRSGCLLMMGKDERRTA